jgi:hypothetical protein
VATDTLIGGGVGKAVPGAKKYAGKAKSAVFGAGKKSINQAKRRATRGWGEIMKREASEEFKYTVKQIAGKAAGGIAQQIVLTNVAGALIDDGSGLGDPGGGAGGDPPSDGLPPGNSSVHLRSINDTQEGIIGIYGAHLYWSLYVEALQRAGRPVPSHPNQTLDNF